MDHIDKALNRFSAKEKVGILLILRKIRSGDVVGLEVKKLQGYTNIYRIRKGVARIIYQKDDNGITILSLSRRNDTTYKDF